MANGFAAEIGPVSRLPFEIFDDRFGAAAHVELLVNVVYVRSDGFQPNTKLVGRFLQDQARHEPFGNLTLSRGQASHQAVFFNRARLRSKEKTADRNVLRSR